MSNELSCPTQTLLAEIANKGITRRSVAVTYFLAGRSSTRTDWAAVNAAILERWGQLGLAYIKNEANRIADRGGQP